MTEQQTMQPERGGDEERRRLAYERLTQPKRRAEFSKLIVSAVMLTYFIGVYIGAQVVKAYPDKLNVYLDYIKSATIVTIGFYVWKAQAENIIKLGGRVEQAGSMQNSPWGGGYGSYGGYGGGYSGGQYYGDNQTYYGQ